MHLLLSCAKTIYSLCVRSLNIEAATCAIPVQYLHVKHKVNEDDDGIRGANHHCCRRVFAQGGVQIKQKWEEKGPIGRRRERGRGKRRKVLVVNSEIC